MTLEKIAAWFNLAAAWTSWSHGAVQLALFQCGVALLISAYAAHSKRETT